MRPCEFITLIVAGLASGVWVLQAVEHAGEGHADDHYLHAHTHSHDGHVHTHWHSHSADEQHPGHDSGGDHHGFAGGHDDLVPLLLITTSRDSRRWAEVEFIGLDLGAAVHPFVAESPAPSPPERPPRPPTRQDSLLQIRTVVLLT